MSQAFTKTWQDNAALLQTLRSRQLIIDDPAAAEAALSHIHYYRFSGYALAFETRRHLFPAGTTFAMLLSAYRFDQDLRNALLAAIAVVEVDLRAGIAHHFGKSRPPFAHAASATFFVGSVEHGKWMEKLHEETKRSHEEFVDHFRRTYSEYPDLPIWAATELMSFGSLSKMLKMMTRDDQKAISSRYQLQPQFLCSWVHHLVYLRNVCAHHARVWDRCWSIKPELPPTPIWQEFGNQRCLASLFILLHLLRRCPATQDFTRGWKAAFQALIRRLPVAAQAELRFGYPQAWASAPDAKVNAHLKRMGFEA